MNQVQAEIFIRNTIQALSQSEKVIFFKGKVSEKGRLTAEANGKTKRIMVICRENNEAVEASRDRISRMLNLYNSVNFSYGLLDFNVTCAIIMLQHAKVLEVGCPEWLTLTRIKEEKPRSLYIPQSVFHDQNKREKWAEQVLTAHVRQRHPNASVNVMRKGLGHKLTGTEAVVTVGGTCVVYTMVEEGSFGEVRIKKEII